ALTAPCSAEMRRDLAHPDPAVRSDAVAYVVRCLRFAAECGVPLVQVLPSAETRLAPLAAREDEWRWSVEGVRAAAREAARLGVRLAVEPINRYEAYLVTSMAAALAYLDAAAWPWVGVPPRSAPGFCAIGWPGVGAACPAGRRRPADASGGRSGLGAWVGQRFCSVVVTVVPLPGTKEISNSSISLRTRDRATVRPLSSIPGPSSLATTTILGLPPFAVASTILPRFPYCKIFRASSEMAAAIRVASMSENPSAAASARPR